MRIVLTLADGESRSARAQKLSTTEQTISKWRRRFEAFRIAGLGDAPRPGRGRGLSDEQVHEVIDCVRQTNSENSTHWSVKQVNEATGVAATSVHWIWRSFVLRSHSQDTFKLSTDPHYVDKVRDVDGLHLNPADPALVLWNNKKSQIQTLDRTQPGLPLSYGRRATRTHDYERHGTTSLFAALDVGTYKVIGQLARRHRSAEFLQFVGVAHASGPADQDVHLLIENYGTHKTDAVRSWFAARPRYQVHFTPTSVSWLNLVERFFCTLSEKWIKRAARPSVKDLEHSIRECLARHNLKPRPFVWRKTADQIIGAVGRAPERLIWFTYA